MAVEALYLRGRLAAMAYSHCVETAGAFGVSIVRDYRDVDDEALAQSLRILGESIGLDGFANISTIRRSDGTNAIFEVDVRPNAWHAYLPRLGLDLAGALSGRLSQADSPGAPDAAQIAVEGVSVRNLTRTIRFHGRVSGLLAIAKRSERARTLPYAQLGDMGISFMEWRQLFTSFARSDRRRLKRGANRLVSPTSRLRPEQTGPWSPRAPRASPKGAGRDFDS